jgi:hypothetical protein
VAKVPVPSLTNSLSSGLDARTVLGSTAPRLWTPPLRELTPETSVGFHQIEFARDWLGRPFDAWQEFVVIHAGELLPDGRPRFRKVLVMVARQNGKTEIPVILSLYWQFVEAVPMILGTSTKLDYAKESWRRAVQLGERAAKLDELRPPRWKREANGEQESWTREDARYKIAAANANAGRSLTVDRLILDELRQHHDYTAWDAALPTGNAVRDFQAWCMSNAGDDRSVVLNDLREAALTYIETGEGDDTLCLLEWSAPEDADPLDLQALAMANPNLGRRIDPRALLGDARKAVAKGGEVLTGFKTECMCIRVRQLDPAVDPGAWARCLDPGDLAAARSGSRCAWTWPLTSSTPRSPPPPCCPMAARASRWCRRGRGSRAQTGCAPTSPRSWRVYGRRCWGGCPTARRPSWRPIWQPGRTARTGRRLA